MNDATGNPSYPTTQSEMKINAVLVQSIVG